MQTGPELLPLARALFLCAAIAACGGDSAVGAVSPPPTSGMQGPATLHAVAGADQSDTARTLLAQALIVEVRSTGGRVAPGTVVRFTSVSDLSVCRIDAITCGFSTVFDTTDTKSQARTLVKLGSIAGTARVEVAVPALGLSDTISFTVRSGAPVRLSLVRDTTIYVGAVYEPAPSVLDAYGNATPGNVPSYTIVGTNVASDGGSKIRAVAIGRAAIAVRWGSLSDTAWITVPPKGTIAVFNSGAPPNFTTGVAKVELDGSGYRWIAKIPDLSNGVNPAWTTSGAIVFETGAFDRQHLYVSDTLGNMQRLTPETTVLLNESYGAPARDGSIYYAGTAGTIDYGTGLYRSASIGATPTRVGPNPPGGANAWKASVSPDGKQLAYSDVNRGGVTILDVATGSIRVVVPPGEMPRWSPLGDWIAFSADSTVYRIRPDGTGRVRIGPNRRFAPRTDWSPDGQWLIAQGGNTLEVINVATGETLPLGWAARMIRPAWRP